MKGWRFALAFSYQRHMHADEIRLAQRLVERHVLDPGLFLLNATSMAEVHRLLYSVHVFMILVRRIVAKNIHIESRALLDHSEPNAACSDDRDGFAGDFIAQEGQIRMPEAPFVGAGEMLGWPKPSGERA